MTKKWTLLLCIHFLLFPEIVLQLVLHRLSGDQLEYRHRVDFKVRITGLLEPWESIGSHDKCQYLKSKSTFNKIRAQLCVGWPLRCHCWQSPNSPFSLGDLGIGAVNNVDVSGALRRDFIAKERIMSVVSCCLTRAHLRAGKRKVTFSVLEGDP